MSMPLLTVTSQLAREPLPVTGEVQSAYLLIEIQANEQDTSQTPRPLNLCLVVDRSGSMRGPRMHYLKEGIAQAVDVLGPDDIFSVVTFDDMVELIIPAQQVTDKEQLKAMANTLVEGGGTAVSLGLSLGLAEVLKNASKEYVNRLVLLTDGATRGDIEQCQSLAQNAAETGVAIDTFGVGAEWDDAFLHMISEVTGGAAPVYLRSPTEIGPAFLSTIAQARTSIASGVVANLKFSAGVMPRQVARVSPFLIPCDDNIKERSMHLRIGELTRDVPHNLLITMQIEPKRGGTFRIAQIEIETVGQGADTPILRSDVVVTFSGSAAKRPKIRPIVLHYVERATAARIILRALEDLTQPRPPLADRTLQLLDREGRELVERYWSGQPLSPEGRKVLYAKVRELTQLRPASSLNEPRERNDHGDSL
jgi:Ca-activated chloride channel homolog